MFPEPDLVEPEEVHVLGQPKAAFERKGRILASGVVRRVEDSEAKWSAQSILLIERDLASPQVRRSWSPRQSRARGRSS
jgi:hypothetical protein